MIKKRHFPGMAIYIDSGKIRNMLENGHARKTGNRFVYSQAEQKVYWKEYLACSCIISQIVQFMMFIFKVAWALMDFDLSSM